MVHAMRQRTVELIDFQMWRAESDFFSYLWLTDACLPIRFIRQCFWDKWTGKNSEKEETEHLDSRKTAKGDEEDLLNLDLRIPLQLRKNICPLHLTCGSQTQGAGGHCCPYHLNKRPKANSRGQIPLYWHLVSILWWQHVWSSYHQALFGSTEPSLEFGFTIYETQNLKWNQTTVQVIERTPFVLHSLKKSKSEILLWIHWHYDNIVHFHRKR